MFNPFKKKAVINMTDVNQVIDGFSLYNQSLSKFIEHKEVQDDILNISLKIHKDADQAELEAMYHKLRVRLSELGVMEVNLNVVLTDKVAPTPTANTSTKVQTFTPNDKIPASTDEPKPAKSAPKQADIAAHPRIRHIIVVASGKGGVGKSTTTVNIALALQKLGKRVGILDADIYGPSIPDMLGVAGVRPVVENDQFVPIDAHGLALLSIGNLIESDNTPVAWRGVKATGALMQLYGQTNWPNLDYLVIDMPPGTGDIQLTLAQRIPITGAVVVTTPQHIALLDAKKGVEMFIKTDIPILGIVENMSLHTCSACGHTEAIFGENGGQDMAKLYGVPLLGQLPIDASIRENMDQGKLGQLDKCITNIYDDIAGKIEQGIGQYAKTRHDGRIF